MRSRRARTATALVCAMALLVAGCSLGGEDKASTPTTSLDPGTAPGPTVATAPGQTVAPTSAPGAPPADTTPLTLPPTTLPPLDPEVFEGISMTSVPADVIVPTSEASLDEVTNPINGRRGGARALPEDLGCPPGTSAPSDTVAPAGTSDDTPPTGEWTWTCLAATLDLLGFDVTSREGAARDRLVRRATAVVQLDAGLPMTGFADDALREYLGIAADDADRGEGATAGESSGGSTGEGSTSGGSTGGTVNEPDEVREIGTSASGRSIVAMRYGDGPRTVLVVGQTHGDEEAGLRVLLRARSLPIPDGVTLWVVPTMNPDGLVADTRFLTSGADPNRRAPAQREQQVMFDFAMDVRPSLSIWYHQNYGWVGGSGASWVPAQRYQEMTALGTLKRSGNCATAGFMWCPIDDALGASSILVELPDVVTPAEVQRHALALLSVAADAPA